MADPIHPLTEEDLVKINEGIDQFRNALTQIDLAERAGIDVAAQKQQAEEGLAKLQKIKQVYFPGQ